MNDPVLLEARIRLQVALLRELAAKTGLPGCSMPFTLASAAQHLLVLAASPTQISAAATWSASGPLSSARRL
jgi:hypothetical protein